VLRCLIADGGGEDGSLPVAHVDDREFTWDKFGRMLGAYAGWEVYDRSSSLTTNWNARRRSS
jgi:hypothetical protein